MILHQIARYLLRGSDDLYLHPDWLDQKMPEHDAWTRSQADPRLAIVVKDSAATQREQFWQRVAEKQQRLVKQYPRRLA